MKPLIRVNARNSPVTAQCNVAMQLFDHHSDKAGRRVWDAPTDQWETVAQEYVDLEFDKGVHHSEWVRGDDRIRINALDHHSLQEDTRIAQQLTSSPLSRLAFWKKR